MKSGPHSRTRSSAWIYQRIPQASGVETSKWQGHYSPPLATHFHDEAQISVVQSGRRFFKVGSLEFEVAAGWLAIIPASIPHASIGVGRLQTRSHDVFVEPQRLSPILSAQITIAEIPTPTPRKRDAEVDGLMESIETAGSQGLTLPFDNAFSRDFADTVRSSDIKIAELAKDSRLSREGFIRRFRREMGMTPHAYRLAHRATRARHLLRSNAAPADVAAEVGFADQSHFGRVFLKKFGTTPGAYRQIWQD